MFESESEKSRTLGVFLPRFGVSILNVRATRFQMKQVKSLKVRS